MKPAQGLIVAALEYAAWPKTLYFIATPSNSLFLASDAIPGGAATPATGLPIQDHHEGSTR